MKVSFVIPCYRSSENIRSVVAEINETMQARPEFKHEIILVNDCSPDNTFQVLSELALEDPRVIAVNLAKNVGQMGAMMAGFSFASGDVVTTSDDDGQTPVNQVFRLIDKLDEGYDVVCARYVERDQPSWFRRMGTIANERMSDFLIEKPSGVYMAAFFAARRFVIDEMLKYRHPYPYLSGLILRVTQKIGNVDLAQRSRISGSSGYTIKKLLRLWLNGFTAFSIKPLRGASVLGGAFALIGLVALIVSLIVKLASRDASLMTSVIVGVLFLLSGVQLIAIGLVGEYVGRMYMCINNTPQYVVRDVVSSNRLKTAWSQEGFDKNRFGNHG